MFGKNLDFLSFCNILNVLSVYAENLYYERPMTLRSNETYHFKPYKMSV